MIQCRPYALLLPCLMAIIGCGTTRMTDTQRTATEQLLVSNAIDQVVSEFDFSELSGKPVYIDIQYLEGTVDRGYLVSSIRQHLLATGCILEEDRNKATYVIELRSGAIGTDRHSLLVGVPQMNVPSLVPGQPSQIPEIPLAKKTDQEGYAKIAVFAYNRLTGHMIWQSGTLQAMSTSKDTWLLGAGPFQQGSIREGTEFAGEPIAMPRFADQNHSGQSAGLNVPPVTKEASWPEPPSSATTSKQLAHVLGNAPTGDRADISQASRRVEDIFNGNPALPFLQALQPLPLPTPTSADTTASSTSAQTPAKPATSAPTTLPGASASSNQGGQVETEPTGIMSAGLHLSSGTSQASAEPSFTLDFSSIPLPRRFTNSTTRPDDTTTTGSH